MAQALLSICSSLLGSSVVPPPAVEISKQQSLCIKQSHTNEAFICATSIEQVRWCVHKCVTRHNSTLVKPDLDAEMSILYRLIAQLVTPVVIVSAVYLALFQHGVI